MTSKKKTMITLNDLIINPQNINIKNLLEDWKWILKELSKVVLITAMGDLFIQGESGKVYFLDVCAGQLSKISENGQEFESFLSDVEFVTDYFYPKQIVQYRKDGLNLQEEHCYSHTIPLVLGGKDEIDNIEITDVQVYLNIMGQVHMQIKNLPLGTKIDSVVIKKK